jgi:hypothetical protein
MPEYHGNPIDPNGSLVCMDWGTTFVISSLKLAGSTQQLFPWPKEYGESARLEIELLLGLAGPKDMVI